MSVQFFRNGKLLPISGNLYSSSEFPGQISIGFNDVPAPGWLLCDGKAYKKEEYKNLWDVIGDKFNTTAADGEFNVPDMRGRYIMGANNGITPGTKIAESLPQHSHTYYDPGHSHSDSGCGWAGNRFPGTAYTGDPGGRTTGSSTTKIEINNVDKVYSSKLNEKGEPVKVENTVYQNGAKVRPDSIAVNYFIKF